jgi:hypothetical protein
MRFICGKEQEVTMNAGDTVLVRATGRRARIVEDRGNGFHAIEYLPSPADDPIDRDTVVSEEVGIYRASDLEVVETAD